MTLNLLLELKFYYPAVARNTMLNGEGGSDKRQVAIHIFHSKLQFPSKVSLA
jgi:hypothetical protein